MYEKIDCSITKNYLAEKARMIKTNEMGECGINCKDCPMSYHNNRTRLKCNIFEVNHPKKAIEIIQKWSDEHPLKTYLSEFLKHYPNATLQNIGDHGFCLKYLGVKVLCDRDCQKCWNRPIEE